MTLDMKQLLGETTEYDKKESLEMKRPKSWLKSVSAFANGIGGTLIFGISNDDTVVGIEDVEHDAEAISECIKTKIDPIPDTNLHFYTENGKKLIILDVRAGLETPYYYVGDGNRIAFVRVGNESIPADNVALKRLVLKGTNRSYDSLVSKYKFENMAFTKLRSVYKYNTGKDFEDTDYESWGIIDEDGNLTNAGALLADESPIRHSRVFCTRWNGLDKASGVIDAVDDEEISGGLVTLLQESVNFVSRNTKKAWRKTGTGRIEMPDYPDRAVLEGIVNALIHRDYLTIGSEVHIDMFDDRLEIYSPGGMPDGRLVQNLDLRNVSSKRRNPVIADIFNRLNYMDRRGSGFKKILDSYEFQENYTNELKPEFQSDNDEFWLIFKNLNYKKSSQKSAVKNGGKNRRQKTDGKKSVKTQKHLDDIIQYMRENKEYKASDIADVLGLQLSRTRELLKMLVTEEKIQSIGEDKNRRYLLKEK